MKACAYPSEVILQGKSMENKRIGQLLVKEGVIDEGQIEQALTVQAQQTIYKPLGEILRELGFITKRKLREVLLRYQKQIQLGELLVKMGVISDYQLMQVLFMQEHGSKKLGQLLAEKGFVTRSNLVSAICLQLGISGIDEKSVVPDKDLLDTVNVAFLRRRRVLPLKYDKNSRILTVLLEDPTDRETIADLEKLFKAEVEPVMLRTGTVDNLLDELFDMWHLSR
jgi:type IV pilus assembly protein PilB